MFAEQSSRADLMIKLTQDGGGGPQHMPKIYLICIYMPMGSISFVKKGILIEIYQSLLGFL